MSCAIMYLNLTGRYLPVIILAGCGMPCTQNPSEPLVPLETLTA